MQVLFTGGLDVHYGQVYVQSGVEPPQADLRDAFAGQVNGLCGAATPGWLFMVTGLHTGYVGFTVELHDTAPADRRLLGGDRRGVLPGHCGAGDARPAGARGFLAAGDRARGPAGALLRVGDGPGSAGRHDFGGRAGARSVPAPASDQVLKQTSANAANWHRLAQELPPPPSAEEKARMAEQAEREEQARRWELEVDLMWGGVPPTARLLAVGGSKFGLVKMDRALLDAMAVATPLLQRDIARWAACRACDHAGLSSLDWVRPASMPSSARSLCLRL